MKIYTKGGDKGETSLLGGERVSKDHYFLRVYGALDEVNSILGIVVSLCKKNSELMLKINVSDLVEIQRMIFTLGSICSCNEEDRVKFKLTRVQDQDLKDLENKIDYLESELPELKNFILPGGSEIAGHVHLARTKIREVERLAITVSNQQANYLSVTEMSYLNRLSDYLFCEARYINYVMGITEQTWP